jgi:hypothetical protein
VAEIVLSSGEIAIVDDEDFERVNAHRWHIAGPGYVGHSFREDGRPKMIYLHHFVLNSTQKTDHENRNKLDNRKNNLRTATSPQNSVNSAKQPYRSSKYKGVYWDKKNEVWRARIGFRGCTNLGQHPSEKEAAASYNEAAKRLYGAFAELNDV